MKSGRGLFQLWLIGTAIWMVGWVIAIHSSCAPLPDGELVCRPDFLVRIAKLAGTPPFTFAELALWGLPLPLVVLIVGVAAFGLFRSTRSN